MPDAVGRGIEVREAVATVDVQQRLNASVHITLRWSATVNGIGCIALNTNKKLYLNL